MRKKIEPLQKKRRPVNKSGLMILHSKTRSRKRKQRVAAGAAAGDLGSEVPNLGVARALFVILILHVGAVAAIFIHNRVTNDDPVVKKSTVDPAGASAGTGGGSGGAAMVAALPQVEQGEDYYFVATGDTYERIADLKQVDLDALRELNNNVALRAGRILRLPSNAGGASSSAVVVRAAVPASVPPPQREQPRSVAEPPTVAVVVDAPPVPVVAQAGRVEESPPESGGAVRVRPAQAAATGSRRYTVKTGDTVWSIANRHGVDQQVLMSRNGLADPRKLRVGVTLTIPAK
ncbi:MAG: LysM peptidoglycan-binding domain-containing protein [Akkermansiaceae bacterium]|nr:LysM peptidoglycan-binding domain-containing protein [Akkermansiaceae bacterium]NNM28836.1 LysM peptidoglycan-binding domain-containing protein [Akkermansiaceae bacterium]